MEPVQQSDQVDEDGYEHVNDDGAPVITSPGVYDEVSHDQEPVNDDNNNNNNENNDAAGGTDIPGDFSDQDGDPNDYGEDQNDEE